MEMTLDVTWWVITMILIIGGFIGTFLPVLPGPAMIFTGMALHYWLLGPEISTGWTMLTIAFILLILTAVLEWASSALGAKWFGATKWGIIGAIVGGILGIFFPFPGILVGPLVGSFAFEMIFAKQAVKPAGKSTWGTLVGTTAGLIGKVVLAGLMVLGFFLDIFWLKLS